MNNLSIDIGSVKQTLFSKVLFFLLLAVPVWTTLLYGTVHQPIIALFYLMMVAVAVLWALDAFSSGYFRFNRTLLIIPIAATIAYGLIQVVPFGFVQDPAGVGSVPRTISVAPYWTLVVALHLVALLIYFAATTAYIDSAARLRKLVILVTAFGFLYAFFSILQAVLSPNKIYGIYESRYAVPFGSFVNRHDFAAFIEMTISLPLGLLFAGAVEKDKRLIYITATGLMGIALVLSGSRGGLVSIVSAVCFLIILSTGSKGKKDIAIKAVLGVVMIGIFSVGAVLIGGETSLTRIAETARSNNLSTNRVQIWTVSLDVIRANFPLGAGLGAFGVAYTPFDPSNGIERVEQAHNDYLEVLADAGLVGAVIGAGLLFLLFRTGLRSIKTENLYRRGVALGALTACFSILVHSMFDFVLHITAIAVMFLTMMALVVVSGRSFGDDIEIRRRRHRKRSSSSATVTSLQSRRS